MTLNAVVFRWEFVVMLQWTCEIWTPYTRFLQLTSTHIGVARGCTGCMCTPRTEKKFLGQIYRGTLKVHPLIRECTPEAEQESIFSEIEDIWPVGSAPPRQNPGYAYKLERNCVERSSQRAYTDVDFALWDEQHLDGRDEVLAEVGDVDVALVEHLVMVPHVHRVTETFAQLVHVLRCAVQTSHTHTRHTRIKAKRCGKLHNIFGTALIKCFC